MLYDWSEMSLGPAVVKDADGTQYRRVVRVDTVSGDIETIKVSRGVAVLRGDEIVTNQLQVPAPVTVQFIN